MKELKHFGVLGMKWGRRKAQDVSTPRLKSSRLSRSAKARKRVHNARAEKIQAFLKSKTGKMILAIGSAAAAGYLLRKSKMDLGKVSKDIETGKRFLLATSEMRKAAGVVIDASFRDVD